MVTVPPRRRLKRLLKPEAEAEAEMISKLAWLNLGSRFSTGEAVTRRAQRAGMERNVKRIFEVDKLEKMEISVKYELKQIATLVMK